VGQGNASASAASGAAVLANLTTVAPFWTPPQFLRGAIADDGLFFTLRGAIRKMSSPPSAAGHERGRRGPRHQQRVWQILRVESPSTTQIVADTVAITWRMSPPISRGIATVPPAEHDRAWGAYADAAWPRG